MTPVYRNLSALLLTVCACCVCEAHLPLGPGPVLQAGAGALLPVVGQAPSARLARTRQGRRA